MINLIPPQGHSALRHEYLLRVASMYCFILGGVFVASAALMIPTYVITSAQLKAVRSDNSENQETTEAFSRASEEIRTATAMLSQLRISETAIVYSTLIEEIVRSAPSGIAFTTFQGRPEKDELTQITIQGLASTRNVLASFKDALESSAMFEKADIPISDLARDTNLPFVITVTLRNKTTP